MYASELCIMCGAQPSFGACTQDAANEGAAQRKDTEMLRDELHEAKERVLQLQRALDDAALEGTAQRTQTNMLRDELHEAKQSVEQLQRAVNDARKAIDN